MLINQKMDKKDIYFNIVEYYSAIKRDKLGTFIAKWMDPETILLSEITGHTCVNMSLV